MQPGLQVSLYLAHQGCGKTGDWICCPRAASGSALIQDGAAWESESSHRFFSTGEKPETRNEKRSLVLESDMTKEDILLANKNHLFPSVFHYYKEPLVVSHAKDQYVWDADGNQYLDFFGGIVTISVGHCNEEVNRKVHAQIDKLEHVSTVFSNEPQVALAQKLAQITPGGALRKSFFTNSGSEANETAIVAARY